MVDFYGFHVGKYTSPMDPMGFEAHQTTTVGGGLFVSNVFFLIFTPKFRGDDPI